MSAGQLAIISCTTTICTTGTKQCLGAAGRHIRPNGMRSSGSGTWLSRGAGMKRPAAGGMLAQASPPRACP